MTVETENGEICSLHHCPLHTCAADCPNKNGASADTEPDKEKRFTKQEITREIKLIAQESGIESGDFQPEPENEVYDDEGNLIFFVLQVTQEYAHKKGEGKISYQYVAKGRYTYTTKGLTFTPDNLDSCIIKAYGSMSAPDKIYCSDKVAVLKSDTWERT